MKTGIIMSEFREKYDAFCIPIIVVPVTYSNNVPGTDFSLGADTALNQVVKVMINKDPFFFFFFLTVIITKCLAICWICRGCLHSVFEIKRFWWQTLSFTCYTWILQNFQSCISLLYYAKFRLEKFELVISNRFFFFPFETIVTRLYIYIYSKNALKLLSYKIVSKKSWHGCTVFIVDQQLTFNCISTVSSFMF